MAKRFKAPGLYVEEFDINTPIVAQVASAIPSFIGYTEKAIKNGESLHLTPTRIQSLIEYVDIFGKAQEESNFEVEIRDNISVIGAVPSNRKITISKGENQPFLMYYAMQLYFENGGSACYVTSTGNYLDLNVDLGQLTAALGKVKSVDEPTLLVFPDAINLNTSDSYYTLINRALQQCRELKDRFTIVDLFDDDVADFRTNTSLGHEASLLKYGAAYHPYIETIFPFSYGNATITINHMAIDGSNAIINGELDGLSLEVLEDADSPLFNPSLLNQIKQEIDLIKVCLPPSSAMAGIYVRMDQSRGVWKAPAGVSISSCIKPLKDISDTDQERLNMHNSGKSINAIRSFPGKGVIVWGARTLAGNDNEWRYISVNRFVIMVNESIKKSAEVFVFEPNDANTWLRIKSMIKNYLSLQWRSGALAGDKEEKAFFVNVGLGRTMTAIDVLEGRIKIEIGMAIMKPAEFIISKITLILQDST